MRRAQAPPTSASPAAASLRLSLGAQQGGVRPGEREGTLPSAWIATATEASGKQEPPARIKKKRQRPIKAADQAHHGCQSSSSGLPMKPAVQKGSGRAKPRAKAAKAAPRRPAAVRQAPARPRGAAGAPDCAAQGDQQSAPAAATTSATALEGGAYCLLCSTSCSIPAHTSISTAGSVFAVGC